MFKYIVILAIGACHIFYRESLSNWHFNLTKKEKSEKENNAFPLLGLYKNIG